VKIHEYQAKEVLARYGVPTLRNVLCTSAAEAGAAFTSLGTTVSVVKAQVHAGGRGKGGGVKLVKSAAEATTAATTMMSQPLVTKQTGAAGVTVRKVLVEEGCDIKQELYLGITLDRNAGTPVVMGSTEGGVEIEEVAATHPEKILKEHFDPETGLSDYQARRLAFGLGLTGKTALSAATLIVACARAFWELDAALVEINPLVITGAGDAIALDAKFSFEDNGLPRHRAEAALRDLDEEDPSEVQAKEYGLSYIKLDGTIGCLVNGAGLAMATLDVIRANDAWPANFLDVGGGASTEQVSGAFGILLGDPSVKAVLVNIFGGIMSCRVIAEGIIAALSERALTIPLVVRLEGNEVAAGRALLEGSGLKLQTAGDLDEAAAKAVAAAKGAH
jgi:succinyl-CoA synthetase beta subunit